VPAAAVIPAPKVYTKAVAVKTLVVESRHPGQIGMPVGSCGDAKRARGGVLPGSPWAGVWRPRSVSLRLLAFPLSLSFPGAGQGGGGGNTVLPPPLWGGDRGRGGAQPRGGGRGAKPYRHYKSSGSGLGMPSTPRACPTRGPLLGMATGEDFNSSNASGPRQPLTGLDVTKTRTSCQKLKRKQPGRATKRQSIVSFTLNKLG